MTQSYVIDFDTQSFLENQCFPYISYNPILKNNINSETMILFYSVYNMITKGYTGYKQDIKLMQEGKNYLFDDLLQKSNSVDDLDKFYKTSTIRCIPSFLNVLFKKNWKDIGSDRISENDLQLLLEGVDKIQFEKTVTKVYRPVSTPYPLKATAYSDIKLGFAILAIATAITSEETGGYMELQKNINLINKSFENFLFQLDGWKMRGQQDIKGETKDVPLTQTKRTINYEGTKRNETKKMTIYLIGGDELNPRLKAVRKLAPDLTSPIDYNFIISRDNKRIQEELKHHLSSFIKVGIIPNPDSRWTITYVLNTDDSEPYADSIISNTFNLINKLYANEIKAVQDATKDIPDVLKLIDFRAAFLDNVLTISWNKLSKKGNILTRLFSKKGNENDIYKRVLLNIDISVTKQVENKKVLQEQKENIIIPAILIENDEATNVGIAPSSQSETTAKVQLADEYYDILGMVNNPKPISNIRYDVGSLNYSEDFDSFFKLATTDSNTMRFIINDIVNPILNHHDLDIISLDKDKNLVQDLARAIIRFKYLIESGYLTPGNFIEQITHEFINLKFIKLDSHVKDIALRSISSAEFYKKYLTPDKYAELVKKNKEQSNHDSNKINKSKFDPKYNLLDDDEKAIVDKLDKKDFLRDFIEFVKENIIINRDEIGRKLKSNLDAYNSLLAIDYNAIKAGLPRDNTEVINETGAAAYIIGCYIGFILGLDTFKLNKSTRVITANNPVRKIEFDEIKDVIRGMLKVGNVLVFKTTYSLNSEHIKDYSNTIEKLKDLIERMYSDKLDYTFANLIIDMNIKMVGNAILIALPPTSRIKVLDTHNTSVDYEDSDVIVGQIDRVNQPEFEISNSQINPEIYKGGKEEMVNVPGGFYGRGKYDPEVTKIPESLQLDEGRFSNLLGWLKDKYNGDVEVETDKSKNSEFWNSIIATIVNQFNLNSKNKINFVGIYPKSVTANKLVDIINFSYNNK